MITLKTLPQATAQEVYNQAKAHLMAQGKKSESDGRCLYRDGYGCKCAAGCFIGDDEYDSVMDNPPDEDKNTSWRHLAAKGLVPKEHVYLIASLQGVHDWNQPEIWEKRLKNVASNFNLEP